MEIFIIWYIIPTVLVFLLCLFFDDELSTIGDLLEVWWGYLTPFLNILILIYIIIIMAFDRMPTTKFKKAWN